MAQWKRGDMTKLEFPVGYHEFHEDQLFNFQLNRWHSLGYLTFEDMQAVGRRVGDFADWKAEMLKMAETALSQEKLMEAAFFYRAAEFYAFQGDRDKEILYKKFIDLFYRAFSDEGIERLEVPYGSAWLPAIRVAPGGGKNKGTIVIHGGFDSFIEEFYSMMKYLSDQGYEVIGFEGPGQGGARHNHELALEYEWERPAKAVLNHFELDDVTWLGISMGGYLCFRAAAFEPRIGRVIALGIAYDYTRFTGIFGRVMMKLFFNYLPGFTNWMTLKKMKQDRMHAWTIGNLMYISDTDTPMEAAKLLLAMNAKNLHSELVTQDVLILTGREDHFIPFKMHEMQVKALTNAKSVTAKVFTREEQAQNHCMIGNIGLALDVMLDWMQDR
jgi:pimeloyl-ACP methyl ester carboxylesterase